VKPRLVLLMLALAALGSVRATSAAARQAWKRGVVGLEITWQTWDEARPWAKKNPATRHASGVVVEGGRILTTAQMISDATLVKVETFGRTTDVTLGVVLADHAINLALLVPDNPAALSNLKPVRLARRTPSEGTLETIRWKEQQLESAVSRIHRFDVEDSYFGLAEHAFVLLQTDMSGGGWAEPVFDGDKLVALTASQESDQRSRAIPVEILSAFLRRASPPKAYRGFPDLDVAWQTKEGPAASAFLGQTGAPTGVILTQVPWGSSACGVLKPRDVLLSMDGQEIDGAGYYAHPRLGRLRFTQIAIDGHEVGDLVPVRVLRDGRALDLTMRLAAAAPAGNLMPASRDDQPPPYVVKGGLVFRELDGEYLAAWGSNWVQQAPALLVARYLLERQAQRPGRQRVVVISSVLPSAFNVGYQDARDTIVERINGRPIDSLASVVQAFEQPQNGFHTLALAPGTGWREIVLDASLLGAATSAVLEQYRVPAAQRLPNQDPPTPESSCPGDF
jgi:hypothetical protein